LGSRGFAHALRLDKDGAHVFIPTVMPVSDPYAFQLAGFQVEDVEEILADLDYLHRNCPWTHRRDQIERMIVESPVILMDFLRSIKPEVVRSAMIPRRVKEVVLRPKVAV
jgi:hypothetical protein